MKKSINKYSLRKGLVGMLLAMGLLTLPFASWAQQSAAVSQLSLNENAFGPAGDVKAAIVKALDSINRYPTAGDELIRQIAAHEGVQPEQIIPGELLGLLGVYLGLKGGVGSEFIYTVPGYPAMVDGAAKVGGKVIEVPLNDRLENDLPAIAKKVNAKTQAIYLVNPHNPSGTVSERQTFHNFIHEISKQAIVVVDEAYLEFADHFAERTAVNNIKEGDQVIVFRTFAKAYGLAGLSIGYAVAPKALAAYLRQQGLGDVHELNRLSIVGAATALKNQQFIERAYQTVLAERDKWNSLLDSLHLKHTESQANFVYFDTGKPVEQVAAYLKKAGVVVGRAFAPYNTWVRISIGLQEENEQAREAIRQLMQANE